MGKSVKFLGLAMVAGPWLVATVWGADAPASTEGEPKDVREVQAPVTETAADDLFEAGTKLLVRAGAKVTENRIRSVCGDALQKVDPTEDPDAQKKAKARTAAIVVTAENAIVFEHLFDAVTSRGKAPEGVTAGPRVRQLPTSDAGGFWELRLDKPTQTIILLDVDYGADNVKTYKPVPPTKPGDLTWMVPSVFVFKPESQLEPKRYRLEIGDVSGPTPKSEWKDWPRPDRFFVVGLPPFRGKLKQLLEVVHDVNQVGNAFDRITVGDTHKFVFVDIEYQGDTKVGDVFDGNNYIPRIPGLSKQKAVRVWIRFPLNEQQAREELALWSKLAPKELSDFIRLPLTAEQIRAELAEWEKFSAEQRSQRIGKLKDEQGKGGPAYAADTADLDPEKPSQWIELPRASNSNTFERMIPLTNFGKWYERFPQVWRLVVWEFGEHETAGLTALEISDELKSVLSERVKEWPEGVQSRLAMESGAKEPAAKAPPSDQPSAGQPDKQESPATTPSPKTPGSPAPKAASAGSQD